MVADLSGLDRHCLMGRPPSSHHLAGPLAPRVLGLRDLHSRHRVATPQSDQRIPHPLGPQLEGTQRQAARQVSLLTAPAPDDQSRLEKFGAPRVDTIEEVRLEHPGLGVLHPGIEAALNEPADQVFRDREAVSRKRDPATGAQAGHQAATQRPQRDVAFGHNRHQRFGSERPPVDVVEEQDRCFG